MKNETIEIDETDHRFKALVRAVNVYGDRLEIEPQRRTVTTLQGAREAGWIVMGRSHGGDYIGCVFESRALAQAHIETLKKSTRRGYAERGTENEQ